MIRWFAAMLAVSLPLAAASATADLAILPVGKTVTARVMQLGFSPEAAKLMERFKAALARQPEWVNAYIAKYKNAAGTLPYDPKMGLSKTEYEKMVQFAQQPSLVQAGTVELSATRQSDNSLQLVTKPHLPGIDGIVVAGGGQAVTTSFAKLTDVKAIDNANPNSPTGRWAGTQWRYESVSGSTITSVKFALGERSEQHDAILYFDVKDVGNGKNNTFSEILLFPPQR